MSKLNLLKRKSSLFIINLSEYEGHCLLSGRKTYSAETYVITEAQGTEMLFSLMLEN